MPRGATLVERDKPFPLLRRIPTYSSRITLARRRGVLGGQSSFDRALGGPFNAQHSAGLPAAPALCKRTLHFYLHVVGFKTKADILFSFHFA